MRTNLKDRIYYGWVWLLVVLLLNAVAGCSSDTPDRLEPQISIMEAKDVSRTEATLSASVSVKGTATLTRFRFVYGLDDAMDMAEENTESCTLAPEVRIIGLKPGHRYGFKCEGWNDDSSAVISSETAYLTTLPNERPSVSKASVLSSGSTGLIAVFDITDCGGDPVSVAGFMVTEAGESTVKCHFVDDCDLGERTLRKYIEGLRPERDYDIVAFAENSEGRSYSEAIRFRTENGITLMEPGLLKTIMGSETYTGELLSISGPLDGDDLHYLRRILGAPCMDDRDETANTIRRLNLNDVSIVNGGGAYDDIRYVESDVIGTGMFADCPLLEEVILPSRATAVRRDAFSRSPELRHIEIPASVTSLLPSSDCVTLENITVSEANRNYRSVDGVLFDDGASRLIWFPTGKKGSFLFPDGMTAIGENALRGCLISQLTLPSALKELGRGSLSETMLESIAIPDGVANIPEALFQGCRSLTDVTLGTGTEYIGNFVFDGCPLADLTIKADVPPVVSEDTFASVDEEFFSRCVLHVPEGSLGIYRNHAKWNKFRKITTE